MTIIAGARVAVTDHVIEQGWVEYANETIVAVGAGRAPGPVDHDLGGRSLLPGFVDQHCHGGGGASFITTDRDEARAAVATHRAHGTTSQVASLVAGSAQDLLEQVGTLVPLAAADEIVGIHLEGPWISTLHCGAHDPELLRAPDLGEVAELLAAGDGHIRMITIAPELPGAIEAIELMVDAGVIAAVGHTDADFVTTKRAIDAGANVATHLSNAMRPLHHREPAAIGALLEDPRVAVEVIADGTHVHPAVLRILFREAGDERVCLITDAMAAAGADDGHYRLGKLNVEVVDGVARLEETGAIAGSSLTMDGALRYLSLEHGTALERLCVRLSTNPARVLGLDDRGTIAAGQRADLVVIDHYLQVQTVIRRGEVVSGAW